MDPQNFDDLFHAAADAVKLHDWRILAAVACVALTWAFRWGAGKIPGKLGAWIKSDQGGAFSALLMGVLGSLGHALFGKEPFSAQFLVDGVVMGVTAAGGYATIKKLLPGASAAKAAGGAMALFLGLSLGGCAWLQAHPAVAGALNCAEEAIVQSIPGILGDVGQALSGSSPDWKALGGLEASKGIDVVICAAEKLLGGAIPGAAPNPQIHKNARAYLDSRRTK